MTPPLIELVTIRQLRRKRIVRDGETRVELSLDEVDVVSRSRVIDQFVELEAELVRGDESRLAGLAEVFTLDPALAPAGGSKLEAAMQAVRKGPRRRSGATAGGAEPASTGQRRSVARNKSSGGIAVGPGPMDEVGPDAVGNAAGNAAPSTAPTQDSGGASETAAVVGHLEPPAVIPTTSDVVSDAIDASIRDDRLIVGKTPGVTADDHVAEAGRKVMRFHLARMLAREAGTRAGVDAEELHGMRVATRRQRAAWRVFGASFRPGRTRRYRKGLRDVAARLGAVRDLDVLLEAADHYRADFPVVEQRALEPLLADWRGHRDDARVLLVRELDSDRYRRWVDDYRDFVRTDGALVVPVGPTQPHHIRDTAASQIWTAYEQVRGYEPVLRWADVETLHELRIAGKWLRYTLEFVA